MKVELEIRNFQKQQAIFDHPAKFKIVVKGRRFGLTKGAANDFIQSALERKFKKGLWVDTVNSNIERYVERYFIPKIKHLPQSMWNWRKQQKILELVDSYIDFRSIDNPENLEGFGYDKAFLNEAGIILKNKYLWDNAIKPMFWDYPLAKIVIGGTPKGMGLFRELAARGNDPEQTAYKTFHYTSFDSPFEHIHQAIRDDIASMPERVIKQEIYAEFLEDTGVVFRGVKDIATAKPEKPITGHVYVMGVDLAKVQDWTVISVYDRATNRQVYQDRFQTLEWSFQKKKIKSVCLHYNRALIVIDATGLGDPIADDLSRDGLPVEPYKLTNPSKKELIEKLVVFIEQGKIHILNIPESIAEFNNFTYDITNSGRISYNAPTGFHDDIVISHGLAVWSLTPLSPEVKSEPVSLIRSEYLRLTNKGNSDYDFTYSDEEHSEY